MKTKTFAETMRLFEYKADTRTAFDDFLTLTICAFGQNPSTGKSYDEDLYFQTIARYTNDPVRHEFSNLLACLIMEMEKRMDSDSGFDVLGEFYEQHISRGKLGQYFTPWHICKFMATCSIQEQRTERDKPLRIIDNACGSGRMLLAASRVAGPYEHYFGIDLDLTCVKMTALNMFLSGMFHGEVMCTNALTAGEFTVSYRTSFLPFGLFRVHDVEQSQLWYLHQGAFTKVHKEKQTPPDFTRTKSEPGSQLEFF